MLKGLSAVPAMVTLTASGGAAAASLLCTDPAKGIPDLPTGVSQDPAGSNVANPYQCESTTGALSLGNTTPPTTALIGDPQDAAGDGALAVDSAVQEVTDQSNVAAIGTTDDGRNCVIYIDGSLQPTFDASAGNPIGASCLISLGIAKP